ncbi:hypothetical protein PPUJ20028_06790 [Pseudomonas putida]|uniref:Uncharacterized protein n=1 Tax=Pseudomonas putida TaxID=303 RepID=A0AA37RJV1_PSEPU|nr:hypothetical protein [Pseudomonas putida]GLO12098.1 hypothetical protein PPUJ20028_06790 [Pseudomonas putida]GLO35519.1 hypothetical protein PPUN14671_23520 [Pseudomonas putida]HDS0962810.1 hypothetical protein [Pseudomonas putida]HDS0990044.1 hypothetical protein [Pseudomonas putida]
MRAEDWATLGKHLVANATTLESIVQADEEGASKPEIMTQGIMWLIKQHLVDEFEGSLHPSSLLIDLGVRISSQRFELSAPDLQELLVKIEQACERYLSAKDVSLAEAEKEQRTIWLAVRQVVTHLRDEHRATTEFIEGRYGFSPRFKDRLRDIRQAVERLERLAKTLDAFEYTKLWSWCQSDRTLRRLLLTTLHSAIMRQRTRLGDLITRLDQLGVTVRKRNRMRQVVLAVESWIQAGNMPELDGILDRADAAEWPCASPLSIGGYLHPAVEDSQAIDDMALLIHALPAPRVRKAVDDPKTRPAARVVPTELEVVEAPVPFAQPHLEAMLARLKEQRTPQSASRYWEGNAEREYGVNVWLYALDAYYRNLVVVAEKTEKPLRYVLEPVAEPMARGIANQVVTDLTLRIKRRGE